MEEDKDHLPRSTLKQVEQTELQWELEVKVGLCPRQRILLIGVSIQDVSKVSRGEGCVVFHNP